ncbi:hypothetical protein Glove_137g78 [Diversispora epigaea]|uniref:Uncharacterized protein n=1 Tax=Diversispora epigaea TaxID=1348612 RepID=A0A397J0U7_9GLOM|nr:hypothetical protein Glove_137g78 [Diversispora epigaea]
MSANCFFVALNPTKVFQNDADLYFQTINIFLPQKSELLDWASLQLWSKYISFIALPPDTGTTEDSLHAFWDMLVVKPLKIGSPDGKHNRNTSSTRKLRPDLSYLILDACLARGEEKSLDIEGDPAKELIEKLVWTYGQCPYIFGYYAQ